MKWTAPNSKHVPYEMDWTKFKAFADNKLNVAKIMISISDRVKNIVVKGENACYQYFSPFPQLFEKVFFSGSLNLGLSREGKTEQLKYFIIQLLASMNYVHFNPFPHDKF